MTNFVKYLLLLILVLGLIAMIFYVYQISAPVSTDKSVVNFEIKPGESVKQISQELFKEHLIRSKFYFEVYVWQKGWEKRFIAGRHELSRDMNIKEIAKQLVKVGGTEMTITIIEGWNNKEIGNYLEQQGLVSQQDFLATASQDLTSSYKEQFDFLSDMPGLVSLEGYLFPDTYRVFKNATTEEIIKKMLDNFEQKLTNDLKLKIKDQGQTIFEIITLASIIEKEVRNPKDMKMVADIFYKRLKKGIALQSDATVNYITGKGLVQPTAEDIEINHPYNTYKYHGLPSGPISNPGLSAVMAAIEPTENSYYYFLTTEDGTVIYSKTYEEHLRNKARYLK